MKTAIAFTVVALGLAGCGGSHKQTVAPRRDLFGEWRVDASATDSLRRDRPEGEDGAARGRPAAGGSGRPAGGRGGAGGGMGGRGGGGMGGGMAGGGRRGGGGGGGAPTAGNAPEMRAVLETFRRDNVELKIAETSDGVSVRYDGRDVDFPIGKSVKHSIGQLSEVRSTAKWVDGYLEIEHKVNGVKIIETFERGVDSPRLIVTEKIENAFRPMAFRRVYVEAGHKS